MISLRLPLDLENRLTEVSNIEKKTKTEIIKESLQLYLQRREIKTSPYELGKKYIGKYASGIEDKSTNHKGLIREKLRKKRNA